MRGKFRNCLLLAGLGVAWSGPALGVNPEQRLGLHLGSEDFRWKEKDPETPSRTLLVEEGNRISGSISMDSLTVKREGLVYAVLLRAYNGKVDYDGETQEGEPLETKTGYSGTMLEGRLGHRFLVADGRIGIDALGGLGYETWVRDINGARLPDGGWVSGYEEEYQAIYLKSGMGVALVASKNWFTRLEAGIKFPLEVQEEIPALDATLYPGETPSLYAETEVTRTSIFGQDVGLTFYYESYRFDLSPRARSSQGLARQPESYMDVLGLQLGAYF